MQIRYVTPSLTALWRLTAAGGFLQRPQWSFKKRSRRPAERPGARRGPSWNGCAPAVEEIVRKVAAKGGHWQLAGALRRQRQCGLEEHSCCGGCQLQKVTLYARSTISDSPGAAPRPSPRPPARQSPKAPS
jgi:hypothetical protein